MSLLAEAIPPKHSAKRTLDNGGRNFPSNTKHRKCEFVRAFPVNCGVSGRVVASSSLENSADSSHSGESEFDITDDEANYLTSTPVSKEDGDCDFEKLFKDDIEEMDTILTQIQVLRNVFDVKQPDIVVEVGDSVTQEETGGVMLVAECAKPVVEAKTKVLNSVGDSITQKETRGVMLVAECANPVVEVETKVLNSVGHSVTQEETRGVMLVAECAKPVVEVETKVLNSVDGQVAPKQKGTLQGANGVVVEEKIASTEFKVSSFEMKGSQGNEDSKHEFSPWRCEKRGMDEMLRNVDESASLCKKNHVELTTKLDGCNKGRCSHFNEHESIAEQNGLINLSITTHGDPQGNVVRRVLKLFKEQCDQLFKERKLDSIGDERAKSFLYQKVAIRLRKQGMWLSPEKPFGHIPGIEIGDEFEYRAELVAIGLHGQFIAGVDYINIHGDIYAMSIVNSWRYENKTKSSDVLVYSGHGGNPIIGRSDIGDQKLQRGNLALMNSKAKGYPIRVIYKTWKCTTSRASRLRNKNNLVYVYDGLYIIKKCWQDRDKKRGKLVFQFELHRMPDQPKTHYLPKAKLKRHPNLVGVCMINDVSQGKENHPIRVMNGVDEDRLPPFTYITKVMYPSRFTPSEPLGCNCIDGCSNSHSCPCVSKNGGAIPFNKKGEIIRRGRIVNECGPTCKCPPTCMNRVSQNGLRYRLEIFRTTTGGWRVRSKGYITVGSFVCEYVGMVLQDNQAMQRINTGAQMKFCFFMRHKVDGNGISIDGSKFGNIGRFINRSCSPNLDAQAVLYDHADERMPHIMCFANKNIPPMTELTFACDFGSDQVCDANIKARL